MKNLIIRSLTNNDFEDYLRFAKQIIEENTFTLTHIDEFKYTIKDEKEWIESILRNKNNVCIVAEIENEIVGNINILQCQGKKMSHVAELTINVDKKYRNLGIGKKILLKALTQIKEKSQIRKVALQVFDDNVRAIRLYKLFGFKEEGILLNHVCIDNRYVDLVLMRQMTDDMALNDSYSTL